MNTTIFFDYDMFGNSDTFGNILTYRNEDAVKNSIRIWFASRLNDRLRSPGTGGFLDFQITKLMSEERLVDFRNRIARALEDDFNNIFEVSQLEIVPDYQGKFLEVIITIIFLELGSRFNLDLKMRMNT